MSTAEKIANRAVPSVCRMAETLEGSSILRIANEIKDKKKQGYDIYNLTIGDFDSKIYPIPAELEEQIAKSYKEGNTTYPNPQGNPEYREAVSEHIKKYEGLDYSPAEFLIAGGARALVYSVYRTILDEGDGVIYPVPSWNNNHYTHLASAKGWVIETKAENDFMPTADEMAPYIGDANLISLCSPQNPTGTVLTREGMEDICNLILNENAKRAGNRKPVYLMLDQIYWMLTYGNYEHYNPVAINPDMRDYTVFIDGLSKTFCATGLRAGWGFGPTELINKMKSIISHIGAFTATAEQVGITNYLNNNDAVEAHVKSVKQRLYGSLAGFYKEFSALKEAGYPVSAIEPQAAMYLTVKLDLIGRTGPDGNVIETSDDITSFLIDEAKIGLIPFTAFGSLNNPTWFRLSVGTCTADEVPAIMSNLKTALDKIK